MTDAVGWGSIFFFFFVGPKVAEYYDIILEKINEAKWKKFENDCDKRNAELVRRVNDGQTLEIIENDSSLAPLSEVDRAIIRLEIDRMKEKTSEALRRCNTN